MLFSIKYFFRRLFIYIRAIIYIREVVGALEVSGYILAKTLNNENSREAITCSKILNKIGVWKSILRDIKNAK